VAAQSKSSMVLDHSNIGIVGWNTTHCMNVCPRFSALYYPVQVQTLRWADTPSKESYPPVLK